MGAVTSKNNEKFNDYDGFVEKFKPKRTTDDCYTPPNVYDEVVRYVNETIMSLSGVKVLRPFLPGGDYENYDYPPGAVVIDNPPFSIISNIARFYNAHGIKYFLFAPALTLFSAPQDCETYICANIPIVYENGAKVPTSFRTNMLGGNPKVRVAGDLNLRLKAVQKSVADKKKKKILYPMHVITPATLGRLTGYGVCMDFADSDCYFVRKLDMSKTNLYGSGFLLSERAVAEKAVAERAAAERVTLSDREWEIVKSLGRE